MNEKNIAFLKQNCEYDQEIEEMTNIKMEAEEITLDAVNTKEECMDVTGYDSDPEIIQDTEIKPQCLRFGIDAILKVKSNVTQKVFNKNCKDFNKNCIGDSDVTSLNIDVENVDYDDGESESDVEGDDDVSLQHCQRERVGGLSERNVDVTSPMPYLTFPPVAYPGFRPNGMQLSPNQSLLQAHVVNSWSAGLVADFRKERFGGIRRVGHPYQNRTPPKRKKPRTSFTRLQIVELEKRFERQKYLASTERSTLAKSLKMSDAQVKTWFQNRRTKWRRQTAEERELERQAANRLLLSLQSETANRKSVLISQDRICLSRLQRFPDQRAGEV